MIGRDMNKVRLIFTEDCYRNCSGCCNKQYDFTQYPTFELDTIFTKELIITGGEPMLYPNEVYAFIKHVRQLGYKHKIYMYTACVAGGVLDKNYTYYSKMLNNGLDGITLTLHTQSDVADFRALNHMLMAKEHYGYSFRLNVFKGVELDKVPYPLWTIKRDMVWIENCPLPKDEVLMVLR
jgi:MoaA/NifB/PqqE/SkfB family radical SAM enzyme